MWIVTRSNLGMNPVGVSVSDIVTLQPGRKVDVKCKIENVNCEGITRCFRIPGDTSQEISVSCAQSCVLC